MKIYYTVFSLNLITIMMGATSGFRRRIPEVKAAQFWHHIAAQNALIHFEFQQTNFTDAILFAAYDGETLHNLLMAIESSTKFNQIVVKIRSRSQILKKYESSISLSLDNWNQVIFTLDGSVMNLFLNCTSIFHIANIDPEFRVGHVRMLLGQNLHKPKQLQGAIRRFNVEANDRFHWYCMSSESEGNEIAGRNVILPSFFQDNEKTTKTNLILEQILKRLAGLEANVTKWMEVRNLHDQKLRRYELNQKGCQVDGDTVIAVGQKYRNNTECTECICIALNEMNCRRISCATLECEHPVLPAGQCCPVCAKECFYNGRRWRSGQQYWPKNCVKCICDNGNMDCQFLGSSKCPKLDCDEQEIPPNQCCPVCVNIYSCEANLCDPNAICSNTNYGAKCRCKTGFFGNGTVCNDIDECAWDDIAREQLGGCLSGTVCLNLPGSFKCECLPGYQKLDDRTCMDVMRV